jgi:hypothetical protein
MASSTSGHLRSHVCEFTKTAWKNHVKTEQQAGVAKIAQKHSLVSNSLVSVINALINLI